MRLAVTYVDATLARLLDRLIDDWLVDRLIGWARYKHSVGYVAAMAQHLQHSKLMSRSDDPLDTTNANDGSGEAATAATPPFKRKAH